MTQTVNKPVATPSYDLLRKPQHPLDAIFSPRSVAVIGATERPGSVGRTILWNLISNPFGGTVFPVNPKRSNVLGIKAYPTLADIPEAVDLAMVVTPAATVPAVIRECVQVGVKGAVIISAGFRETGPAGMEMEYQILAEAQKGNLRIIGPNCLGVMSPITGLNATFASKMARPGSVAFISQSGALCTSILDWSLRENVGFSAFISIGAMLDVGWGSLIEYLGDDPNTQSIVIYMESIGDARSFLSAAREVALAKPLIVLKAGRTDAAAEAAASHTGALAGSDDVLDAAFRRCGVLRVNRISDLFYMSEVLAKQPRPKGPRLTIVTNAGGPGVIATDALISDGGKLAKITDETITQMNEFLPTHWSHGNPIDVLGDAPPERYAKTLEVAANDQGSDGLLVILTPQAMSDPTGTAEQLKGYADLGGKPILASWMGGGDVQSGAQILNQARIPTFPYPDTAVRLFNYMWRYTYNLQGIYETPLLPQDSADQAPDRAQAQAIIDTALQSGRTLLTEVESKQLLATYRLPVVPTYIAITEDEAVEKAEQIGFPVVLKLWSKTITHKTDVGGVQLNLNRVQSVRDAFNRIKNSVTEKVGSEHFQGVTVQPMIKLDGYELIIGSSLDPQFGPVLLFGTGGELVEVFKDRSLALPPLTTTLARRMMEQTKIYEALKGVRGRKAVDLAALEQVLVRFGQLVVEQPWIKEIDINPLLASGERLTALDARVLLYDPATLDGQVPQPNLAIRPYPIQYVMPWQMKDGLQVMIRPIRPEDEPAMVRFHETLSEESVYLRYAHMMKLSRRVEHERLTRICFIDYDREMALVATTQDPETHEAEILGVGRLVKLHGSNDGEFSMLVNDRYQRRGLGTEILQRLIEIGKDEHLRAIHADILPDNLAMRRICQKFGFTTHQDLDDPMLKVELSLS